MSAYTTINITREKAIATMMEKILQSSDSELKDMMDVVLEPRLYNCRIVDKEENNDDEVI